MFKKNIFILPIVLVLLTGCGRNRYKLCRDTQETCGNVKHTKHEEISIPIEKNRATLNDESLEGFFDEDNFDFDDLAVDSQPVANGQTEDFSWVDAQEDESFKTIYFDFDRSSIRKDQKEVAVYDAKQVKQLLAQARTSGQEPLIVIEGHACHSAGSEPYNLVKSQNRAEAVKEIFTAQGVPVENIKVVGRGQAVPAIVNGKTVEGDREQQWANRRVEVHIINA